MTNENFGNINLTVQLNLNLISKIVPKKLMSNNFQFHIILKGQIYNQHAYKYRYFYYSLCNFILVGYHPYKIKDY